MSGLLEETPEIYQSANSEQQLVVCLSDVWTMRNRDVRVNPILDGQRVVINNPETYGPIAVVEVRAGSSGSEARYWKGAGLTGWTREDLKGCL